MKKKLFLKQPYGILVRKFSAYFLIFSILPLAFLLLFYLKYENRAAIDISKENLKIIIFLITLASILSFFVIRSMLRKITSLSENLKNDVLEKIDTNAIMDLAKYEGEVGDLAKVFSDITIRLQKNIEALEETKKTLHEVLSKVGKALVSIESFESLIKLILETTVDALHAKQGIIASVETDNIFNIKAHIGFDNASEEQILESIHGYLNLIINEKKPISISSFSIYDQEKLLTPPIICMPLLSRDKIWGIICISGKKKEDNFSEDENKILSNLSSQIAISFENAKLSKDIEKTYFETMAALAMAVEAKDPYSRGHSEKVEHYAVKIGEALGISKDSLETLRYAAKLHDVGKIGIADSVLKKKTSLLKEEREIMKKHPVVGESIVKPLKNFQHLLEPIRHHHEFLDGSGYPDGLKGDEISIITRILTVSDIYEALTSDRPYRESSSQQEAKTILEDFVKNGKIDKEATAALFKLIDEKII
ncbi:MAG: HD domain-containing phosphohydrolase [Candidatus Omnitrophota bacterium]